MITLRTHEPDAVQAPEPWVAPLFHRPLPAGARACCCPARAVYAVVVAPSAELPHPPDVLLCGHHMRASQQRLSGEGIAVYGPDGVLVAPVAHVLVRATREPVPAR
jgi:hypothetical protein